MSKCPICFQPSLPGYITCGKSECEESVNRKRTPTSLSSGTKESKTNAVLPPPVPYETAEKVVHDWVFSRAAAKCDVTGTGAEDLRQRIAAAIAAERANCQAIFALLQKQ